MEQHQAMQASDQVVVLSTSTDALLAIDGSRHAFQNKPHQLPFRAGASSYLPSQDQGAQGQKAASLRAFFRVSCACDLYDSALALCKHNTASLARGRRPSLSQVLMVTPFANPSGAVVTVMHPVERLHSLLPTSVLVECLLQTRSRWTFKPLHADGDLHAKVPSCTSDHTHTLSAQLEINMFNPRENLHP